MTDFFIWLSTFLALISFYKVIQARGIMRNVWILILCIPLTVAMVLSNNSKTEITSTSSKTK